MRSILTELLCIAKPLAHQIRDPHIYKNSSRVSDNSFASMVFPVPGGPYNNTPFCAQISAEEESPVHTKLA